MRPLTTETTPEVLGGRLVVRKRRLAASPVETLTGAAVSRRATEAEARWLLAADHAGVVRLRRVDPATGVLWTDVAGSHTLRTRRHPPGVAAAVLSAVAATVAELHRRGLVHGALVADHVILAGPALDRPVLCSPAVTDDSSATPADDVRSLASLAELVRPARGRRARRWAEVIATISQPGHPISADAAATLFRSLGRLRARSERG